jgi:hypothetical protein
MSVALPCRLRRPHVTAEDKPLKVAFLIVGELGQIKLADVTKQRYLDVRQVVGQFHHLRFYTWAIAVTT